MKILGNRVLVSKVIVPNTDEFKTVEVQDDFLYKGKVEQVGTEYRRRCKHNGIEEGAIVLFARNSPDTQDVDHDGQKMKVVRYEDIIAIL